MLEVCSPFKANVDVLFTFPTNTIRHKVTPSRQMQQWIFNVPEQAEEVRIELPPNRRRIEIRRIELFDCRQGDFFSGLH